MRAPLALVATALLAPLVIAAPARADHCRDGFDRDYVCRLALHRSRDGWNWHEIEGRQPTIELERGGSVRVQVSGIDQDGDEFPTERMRFGFDTDRDFDRHFTIATGADGAGDEVVIQARDDSRDARGRIRFWLPGNLGLDRVVSIRIRRDHRDHHGRDHGDERWGAGRHWSTSQERFLCTSLYAAILGRAPDPAGLDGCLTKFRDDGADALIDSILTSREFYVQRRRLGPDRLLEDYYRGLFGRPIDDSARDGFGKRMRKGKYAEVLAILIRSDEYLARLQDAARADHHD